MKSTKDKIQLPRLLQMHAMTPLEERVLAMRHGVVAAMQTRLADASDGHEDLSASLKDLELQVLHRAARRRAQGDAVVARAKNPRGHLRLLRTPKG